MKPYILLPFVLLAGLVIGGLGPRSEMEHLKKELEDTKKLVRGQYWRSWVVSLSCGKAMDGGGYGMLCR